MNITEVLSELQNLTNRNLEILQALNDSFYSKREHITAVVGSNKYNIPSFLYLESKIGDLENNFENLVNAPKTGTAAFVFDGNSQEIQLKSFANTPEKLVLHSTQNFSVSDNQIFKDFLSPNPYVRMDLSEIGNDITEVVVKKIDIKNENLLSSIKGIVSGTSSVDWPDALKVLYRYQSGTDYIEYDTVRRLPIREGVAEGTYTIKKIYNNWTDSDLIEHYTLELNEKLNYWIESGTIQREIARGDHLITSNGKAKLLVNLVDYQKNIVDVTVENGAFADLTEFNAGYSNNEYAILKYFSEVGQDQSKYIDIPLEEDRYIMVFVSQLDSRMNIQGPWGEGLLIDTDSLTIEEDGVIYSFTDYYKLKINNIGDTLYGLTKMFSTDLFNMSQDEYSLVSSAKPEINPKLLQVIEINSHLNDSESVKKIRSLHNQKSSYKSDLSEVQKKIDDFTVLLSELSFADTENLRPVYESELTSLNAQKAELNKNISQIIDEINDNVNSADVPIENAKYHIRGFYDVSAIESETGKKVIKIDVEYRYKNRNRNEGTATSFSLGDSEDSKTYIYSDWNKMPSFTLYKKPGMVSQTVGVSYPDSTDEINVPSFNQIDIPITQGETVDIRLRVQYSDGWPFVEMFSDWSPILNVGFPDEFVANLPIMRIIETNNEDAERYRFRNILEDEGVLKHVGDKLTDENEVYFHQPEHIASGFYTEERRVIPLKDKLNQMDLDIRTVIDEIYATDPSKLSVTISDDSYTMDLVPYETTTFLVPAYNDTQNSRDDNGNAIDILTIKIENVTNHNIKLFSMFPGSNSTNVTGNTRSKFNVEDYYKHVDGAEPYDLAVWMHSNGTAGYSDTDIDVVGSIGSEEVVNLFYQHQNQVVYFRLDNPYDGTMYYDNPSNPRNIFAEQNLLSGHCDADDYQYLRKKDDSDGASLICTVSSISNIVTDNGSRYTVLRPGDSIVIQLEFRYLLGEGTGRTMDRISKTVSFDFWTSLFGDPVNYTVEVTAKRQDDPSSRNRYMSRQPYNPNII